MSNTIYSKYNINPNKLSRDYLNNPLKITKNGVGSERPTKEDLLYLYIELNITGFDIINIFGWNYTTFNRWTKYMCIIKDPKMRHKHTEKTKLRKYGRKNYNNRDKANLSRDETEIHHKVAKSKLTKYGDESYNNRNKYKETCLEKYGRTDVGQFGSPENTKAIIEKYGVTNYTKTIKFRNLYNNKEWVNNI